MKRGAGGAAGALLCMFMLCSGAGAEDAQQANSLLVLPSAQTAFDREFQGFLDRKGAKLLDSYPPSVFIGYIPKSLDKELEEKYGAIVYRGRVEDWSSFARYGEKAVFAVNVWNKRFLEDPPEAPLVVSSMVKQAGKKGDILKLTWNNVMEANSYRLQISTAPDFSVKQLDTLVQSNTYRLVPAFWRNGVYYWRVAGFLHLSGVENREGAFSETYSFAVSKPARPRRLALPAPPLQHMNKVLDGPVNWASPVAFKYYRLQIAETKNFRSPLLDVFTDTCSYKLSGLGLAPQKTYFMRVMGSDGVAHGGWSGVSELLLEPAGEPSVGKKR